MNSENENRPDVKDYLYGGKGKRLLKIPRERDSTFFLAYKFGAIASINFIAWIIGVMVLFTVSSEVFIDPFNSNDIVLIFLAILSYLMILIAFFSSIALIVLFSLKSIK